MRMLGLIKVLHGAEVNRLPLMQNDDAFGDAARDLAKFNSILISGSLTFEKMG